MQVTPDAKFADLGADSLDTVEILMALEEKFDTQIDEEEAQKIATVQEAADVIAAQVGEPPGLLFLESIRNVALKLWQGCVGFVLLLLV